jgi:hypothetical protein
VTRTAFLCALVCLALAALLARFAWRHSRALRAWLRAPVLDPGALASLRESAAPASTEPPRLLRVRGVLEPAVEDALVPNAPFSERRVLWVRASLLGTPAGTPPRHGLQSALWERTLSAPAQVVGRSEETLALALDHPRLRIFAAQEYRHGVVRTLTRVSKVVARALVRAGYEKPPPPTQLFTLEEEALQPGDEVLVYGRFSGGALVLPPETPSEGPPPSALRAPLLEAELAHPLWVTNLPAGRVALRLGWAPLLALWLAVLCVAAAGAVLSAWLVAR